MNIPLPPDLTRHAVLDLEPTAVVSNINRRMLFNKHLGIRRDIVSLEKERDPKFAELKEIVNGAIARLWGTGVLRASFVYSFFKASSKGNTIEVHSREGGKEVFAFTRETGGARRCLSDYILPFSEGQDYIAMFACTVGSDFAVEAAKLREQGLFVQSHLTNVVAMVCAEALAEAVHTKIRSVWGFPDPAGMTREALLSSEYRGKRYSFGYPACPDLSAQTKLFKLLKPADIGLKLTENYMMEPEASVSALVFHHPEAEYFSV